MTGLEEGERPNGNSSCALSRVARALKFCMGTNSDPLFLLVKSVSFFESVLIPFKRKRIQMMKEILFQALQIRAEFFSYLHRDSFGHQREL